MKRRVEAASRRFIGPESGETPLLLGLLLLAILAAYWPIFSAGFVWDDDTFLTRNPLIQASDGLKGFWFSTRAVDYWPVTSSTLWLEWRLWGAHALGYHVTNLALHLADCCLLWAVLRRLRVPGAFLAALLFAVHPVNVESVAWITQRKNVLALFFYLGSIWYFTAGDPPPRRAYAMSLLGFLLGILSKASVVILPVILLGAIAWRRRIEKNDLWRIAPYFLVAASFTLLNLWFQGRHPSEPERIAHGWERVLGAAAVVWFYLGKAVVPVRLMFFYPQWEIRTTHWLWWLPLLAAFGLSAWLWRNRRSWSRPWLFGWAYFVVALIPVMGLATIYYQRFSLVADHYQHLALVAVVVLAAWVWAGWRARLAQAGLPLVAAALAVLVLAALSWKQCLIYRDAETLYRATIAINPSAWLAENNLGLLLSQTGRPAEALAHVQRAVAINPACEEAENNLGLFRAEAGDWAGAITHYHRAIELRPSYAEAHNNFGNALRRQGRWPEAIAEYQKALEFEPGAAGMRFNLAKTEAEFGLAQGQAGNLAAAAAWLKRAVRERPDYAEARANLGVVLVRLGQYDEALTELEAAQRLLPDDESIRNNVRLLREHR